MPSSEQLKLATNFWLASLCSNNLIIKMKLKRTSQERWWLYICFLKALKIVSKCPHQARPVLFKNCLTLSVFGLETGFFFALIRILPEINWSQSQEHKLTSQINKASITIKNHKDGSTNAVKIIFPYLKIWDLWPNWNCNKLKLSQWEEIKARYNMKTRFSFFFKRSTMQRHEILFLKIRIFGLG